MEIAKQRVRLERVEETMLIPLLARALETRRRKGLVDDPKSAAVLAAIDYDFRKIHDRRGLVGCCLRTLAFDSWATAFLAAHPTGTIVEIGVGLNSRFERIDNGAATWIEIDVEPAIAVRRRFFEEGPRRTFFAGSVFDTAWIEHVQSVARGPLFFSIEAVLLYFPADQVRQVFERMAAAFPGAILACDVITRWMYEHQAGELLKQLDARFEWYLDDLTELCTWAPGLTIDEVVTFSDLAVAHRRRLPLYLLAWGPILHWWRPELSQSYRMLRCRFGPGPT